MDSQTGHIVVAYDGSVAAVTAVDWAAAEAQRRSLPLTVIHVRSYPDSVPGMIGSPASTHSARHAVRALAIEGAHRAAQIAGLIDVTPVTEIGTTVGGTLIEFSADATLLVVGTRGHGDAAGALLGSVAFAVSAHASCPVVVVRGESALPPGPSRPILVGVDSSPGSEAVLRYAAAAAAVAVAPLIIVSAYGDPATDAWAELNAYPPEGQKRTSFASFAQQNAENVAETAARVALNLQPGLEIHQHAIEGSTITVLTMTALGCGLLVVGSRGRGSFAALMLGSVSHGVIHSAPCPVAVVRTGKAPGRSAAAGPTASASA